MRELSDRSPAPGAARGPGSEAPPIIEPSQLRPRSSNPPANEVESGDLSAESGTLPSFPPDAIVPATASSGEHILAATPLASDTVPMTAPLPMPVDTSIPRHEEAFTSPFAPSVQPPATRAATPAAAPDSPAEIEGSPASAPPRSSHRRLVLALLAFALLGASIAAVLRRGGGDPSEPSSVAPSAEPASAPTMTGSTMTAAASTGGMMPPSASSTSADDVPPGSEVPSGYGLIEIATPAGARVRVDGALVGTGPLVTSIASPGYHEVRVDQGGRDAKHVVEVRVGKTTRVRSAAPP
jgi:hypothetical protein